MELRLNDKDFCVDMSDTPNPDAHLRMMRAMSYLMLDEPILFNNDGVITIEGKLAPGVDYSSARIMYEHGQQPAVPAMETRDPQLVL